MENTEKHESSAEGPRSPQNLKEEIQRLRVRVEELEREHQRLSDLKKLCSDKVSEELPHIRKDVLPLLPEGDPIMQYFWIVKAREAGILDLHVQNFETERPVAAHSDSFSKLSNLYLS